MPARDKRRLTELEQQDAALSRDEQSIIFVRRSYFFKCRYIYRPVQIVLGILLLLLALVVFISLLLSNINKCLYFVDFKQIFAQGNQTLPNPIDLILTWTGQVNDNNMKNNETTSISIYSSSIQLVMCFFRVYSYILLSHHCTVYNRSVFGISAFEFVFKRISSMYVQHCSTCDN
jgi:hypothetical protein